MSNKGVFLCFDEEHTENLNKKKDFYNSVCSTKYAKDTSLKKLTIVYPNGSTSRFCSSFLEKSLP